ncbi:MAG TPA: glycosyltransferase [Firmicutes bacterium]|nr:glycosyltransferase [Bacillota bacterium]
MRKQITVGHVVASLSTKWGGPVSVITGLLPELAQVANIRVFTPIGYRSGEPDVEVNGVDLWAAMAGSASRFWTGYGGEVAKRLSEFVAGCDVVHIHELWHYPHYVAWQVAQRKKVPVIITPHGALEPWVLRYKGLRKKLYSNFFQRRALREAAFVQALTPNEAELIRRFGVPQDHIRIVPNGIPKLTLGELSEKRKGHQVKQNNIKTKGFREYGLFLGRIHPKKGLDLLVRALPLLITKHPDLRILIAGPDERGHRAYIERLARAMGVGDRLLFLGLVKGDEKWDILTHAKFFLLPSYSEGFSMAILEALAAGIPVVATRACEIGTLEQNQAAILVDSNPEALASAIDQVLSFPELAQRLADNGRRLVWERYTWETVARELMSMYEDALELAHKEVKE